MTGYIPEKPKKFIENLADFNSNDKSLIMSVKAKNIERLKELQIENLWLVGAKEKDLNYILPLINLRYLNISQLLASDLSIFETQKTIETISLTWNTKTETLWDFSKNKKLRTVEITDFSKLQDLRQLSSAKQIENLTIGGGNDKPIKILTLEPIGTLKNLKYLSLTNLKLYDDTLRPIGQLKNLEKLEISNQFDVKEYAWLSSRMPNTICKHFQATRQVQFFTNNILVYDTMVTGRRKPFLLSTKDNEKIEKYISDFQKLKEDLADKNSSS
jgi:hypothetical protein